MKLNHRNWILGNEATSVFFSSLLLVIYGWLFPCRVYLDDTLDIMMKEAKKLREGYVCRVSPFSSVRWAGEVHSPQSIQVHLYFSEISSTPPRCGFHLGVPSFDPVSGTSPLNSIEREGGPALTFRGIPLRSPPFYLTQLQNLANALKRKAAECLRQAHSLWYFLF